MNWKDYFYYDESSTTCLRWRVDRYAGNMSITAAADSVAGSHRFKKDRTPNASLVSLNGKSIWFTGLFGKCLMGQFQKVL